MKFFMCFLKEIFLATTSNVVLLKKAYKLIHTHPLCICRQSFSGDRQQLKHIRGITLSKTKKKIVLTYTLK